MNTTTKQSRQKTGPTPKQPKRALTGRRIVQLPGNAYGQQTWNSQTKKRASIKRLRAVQLRRAS